MTLSLAERHRLSIVGWLATVGTSLALFTAFQEKRYLLLGAGLSAIVVGVGMLLRQLHLPTLLVALVQLAVGTEVLLLGYTDGLVLGFVPTADTFAQVQDLVRSGLDVAQRYAAPVPPSAGLMFLTVAFIAIVALLVDTLGAGLGRAPLAGLPLLALYSVPVASLPEGVPAVCFIPGAVGYLSLLMLAERERLAHWGRHVVRSSTPGGEVVDTSALVSSGRRLSLFAVAVAVVVPILVPTFTTNLLQGSGGFGNGKGNLSFADPMVSLSSALHRDSPEPLVDVVGATAPSYLRLAVLDKPGPNGWRNSGVAADSTVPADGTLPPPEGLASSVLRINGSMNVTLLPAFPDNSAWLPVPSILTALTMSGFPGEFAYVPGDGTVTGRSADGVEHVSSYLANFTTPRPSSQQLQSAGPPPQSIVDKFGAVPFGVPAEVRDVARQVTQGYDNNYDKALALQSFFRDGDNFHYDLTTGYGDGWDSMVTFLQKRRGYCQHFAATMAMMARELGIPSRVVVGFLSPSRDQGNAEYIFTSDDAHAWPELYFSGVGWVRFEPTPGNGATPPPYTHAVQVPTVKPTTPNDTTAPSGPAGGGRVTDLPTTSAPVNAGAGGGGNGGSGGGGVPAVWLLGLVVLLLLVLVPGTIRVAVRRSRLARAVDGGPSSEYAWLELRDRIVDLRLPWTGSLTPRSRRKFVEPLLGGDPDGVAALDRLSLVIERSRYASSPVTDARPADDAKLILAAINDNVERKRRLKAFFWPASLMPRMRGSVGRLRSRLAPKPAPIS